MDVHVTMDVHTARASCWLSTRSRLRSGCTDGSDQSRTTCEEAAPRLSAGSSASSAFMRSATKRLRAVGGPGCDCFAVAAFVGLAWCADRSLGGPALRA
eukprot:7384286-Prymnesium_polylepis.1